MEVEEKPTRSCHKLRHCTESSRVEEKGRKGQRAAERVSKDEAAVRRPGTETMAQMTAGVSLVILASSPEPDMASWQVVDPTADAANPNATHTGPTRSEDKSSNPPEALPSTLFKGGSWTGASNELRKVPVDKTTTSQSTWMPRDESPSREVHGVARSHKEVAGVNIEGGEVDKMSRMTNDGECEAKTSMDMTAAAMTANTSESMDASTLRQPSMPLEQRDGQAMTSDAGAGVHRPNRA